MNSINETKSLLTINVGRTGQEQPQNPRHLSLVNRDCGPLCIAAPPQRGPDDDTLLAKIVEKFAVIVEGLMSVLERALQALSSQSAADAAAKESAAAAEPSADTAAKAQTKAEDSPKTGEFLWKPASDKDGNLVVLLPGRFTGEVKRVRILDGETRKRIVRGRSSGTGNPMNGVPREHFRFDRPGSKIPDNSIVEITLKGGRKVEYRIPETSQRYQR